MADVALAPETTNPKQLFGQGVRAFVLQDYDTAVKAFSTASELFTAENDGDEMHDSLADVYLYYGQALLELARKEDGPLVDGAIKNVEEEEEEEMDAENDEDEEEGENESEKQNGDEKACVEENGAKNGEGEEKAAENGEAGPSDPEKADNTGEDAAAEEELTDLQVAWEVLELAKKIYAKRGPAGEKKLAETLVILGEISLESGNFPAGIEDITEALRLQKLHYPEDSRTLAETLYKLGTAYQTNEQVDEAVATFAASMDCLKKRIARLAKEEGDAAKEECSEIEALFPEIEEKIADMKAIKEEATKKAAELLEKIAKTNGDAAAATTSKQASDISHLVKRKRKDDDEKDAIPAKKPSP